MQKQAGATILANSILATKNSTPQKIPSSAKKMFPFMSKMQAKAINQIKTHPK